MPSIVFALRPTFSTTSTISVHNNSWTGIDKTAWPPDSISVNDPHAISVGRILHWDEGTFDDQGGIIARRSAIGFQVKDAFDYYTRMTGKPGPTGNSFRISRATLSFYYYSLGLIYMVGDVQHTIKRGGSQLNRLFVTYSYNNVYLFEPTEPLPIKIIAPFDPRKQAIPAKIQTSAVDHLKIDPPYAYPQGVKKKISAPLAFITKKGGHIVEVDNGAGSDGKYWIDLTDKLASKTRFSIVFAGSPDGENMSDPNIDAFDYGAALYFGFYLNVKIDF